MRRGWWTLSVVTRYRPRTDVERWQLQDRLQLQLRGMGCPAPRFFEGADGRLGFTLHAGWRPPARLVDALGDIDRPAPEC